jgi:hypothetical protein
MILSHRENTSWALRFGACEGVMRIFVRVVWFLLFLVSSLYASTNGNISGLVTDSSGAVVASATITALNTQTGIRTTTRTDDKGFYSFPSLPIGTYNVEIQETGFKTYTKAGLVLDANSALRADATLPVGTVSEKVEARSGQAYFNTSLFGPEPLGQIGNARRRYFHGPGINNFDLALLKSTKLTESKQLQFRVEAFNIFNHAQFNGPNGNVNSSSFGFVTSAREPRIMQVALKLLF